MIEVYNCGTKVYTKLGNIEGIITCFSSRFDKISYEITYFINDKFETVWMNENEFVTSDSKIKIGYIK